MNALIAFAAVWATLDFAAWVQRMRQRKTFFASAEKIARASSKPLLIVGRPRGWSTHEGSSIARHGCGNAARGDVVVDIVPAPECPNAVVADIRDLSRWPDGHFGAAFVSCVLEHVNDLRTGWSEIKRVTATSPGGVFVVFPQPWAPFALWCGVHKWAILAIRDGRLIARPLAGRGASATVSGVVTFDGLALVPDDHGRKIGPWSARLRSAREGLTEAVRKKDRAAVLRQLADVDFWMGRLIADVLSVEVEPRWERDARAALTEIVRAGQLAARVRTSVAGGAR